MGATWDWEGSAWRKGSCWDAARAAGEGEGAAGGGGGGGGGARWLLCTCEDGAAEEEEEEWGRGGGAGGRGGGMPVPTPRREAPTLMPLPTLPALPGRGGGGGGGGWFIVSASGTAVSNYKSLGVGTREKASLFGQTVTCRSDSADSPDARRPKKICQ